MKEKLLKLFFEENKITFSADIADFESIERQLKISKIKETYDYLIVFLIGIFTSLLLFSLGDLIFKIIYSNIRISHINIHCFSHLIFYFLTAYLLINYYYISKYYNVSLGYLDKKSIKNLKKGFIILIIIAVLGIYNMFYDVIYTINLDYFYIFHIVTSLLLIVLNIIRYFSFLNKIFDKFDKLQTDIDGVV